MISINMDMFHIILSVISTLDNERVTKKLMPILMEKDNEFSCFTTSLARYTQFLSFGKCPHASRLLKEKVRFRNQPQVVNPYDIKLYADHNPFDNLMTIGHNSSPLRYKVHGEYVLQAEIVKDNIIWTFLDFVRNKKGIKKVITFPNCEHPHHIYVKCIFKPPSSLATTIIKQCQTEEGLKELLKSYKFKYAIMAFGLVIFKASYIQNQE